MFHLRTVHALLFLTIVCHVRRKLPKLYESSRELRQRPTEPGRIRSEPRN